MLTNAEMNLVTGGAIKLTIGIVFGSLITLIVGIIDGYLRPLRCN